MPASERAALREALEAVMREAGDLARATARSAFKRWTKGDDDSPVSEADIAVNDLLRAALDRARAATPAGCRRKPKSIRPNSAPLSAWIVDPIDGTRAYIAGRADWTISVALVEDGRPVLAALYAPVTDEMFLASRGEGARLNGAALTVSDGDALAGAKIAGPKRYLDRLGALNAGYRGATQSAFARPAACPRRARGTRRRLCLARQPRLGPCRGRPFGARSRRRDDRLCRPAAALQSPGGSGTAR